MSAAVRAAAAAVVAAAAAAVVAAAAAVVAAAAPSFSEEFEEQDTETDRQNLRQDAETRMTNLVTLIQDTIATDSWLDRGGQATITAYETKKLVVQQTPDNHTKIMNLLQEMRKALGHQVSIEARFLVVSENILEEIGLDVFGNIDLGSWGQSAWRLQSFEMAEPTATGLPGSWDIASNTVQFPPGFPTTTAPQFISEGALMGFFGGQFGGILDNLQANFLIRATQARADSESLTAPKVTVLSGESATLQVRRPFVTRCLRQSASAAMAATAEQAAAVAAAAAEQAAAPLSSRTTAKCPQGPTLNITPTITPDRKHVLLNITAELRDFLGFNTSFGRDAYPGARRRQPTQVFTYDVSLPQTERSRVRTRVSVPDSGTLLLGGLKRTAGTEKEVGVPILSKIPILGRFSPTEAIFMTRKYCSCWLNQQLFCRKKPTQKQ